MILEDLLHESTELLQAIVNGEARTPEGLMWEHWLAKIKEQVEKNEFITKMYRNDRIKNTSATVYKRQMQKLTGVGMEYHYYCGNCSQRIHQSDKKCTSCKSKLNWK